MFQDIMTAVTGILILIVILQIIQVNDAPSKATESNAATAEQHVELQKVQKELQEAEAEDATLRGKLRENAEQEELDVSPISSTEMTGEITRDQQQLQQLENDLIKDKKTEQDRDASVGLIQDEQNLATSEQQATTSQVKIASLQQQGKDKQSEVHSLEIKLQNAEELQKRLYLIPDESQTSKEPVVAVVSKTGIEFSRFNHPADSKQVTDVMGHAIDSYSSGDQYFVFYIKPSGVGVFEKLYHIAQEKGFDVGFDAIEEAQQIVIAQPPGSDSDEAPPIAVAQSSSGSAQGTPSPSARSKAGSPVAGTTPNTKPAPDGMTSSIDVAPPASPTQNTLTNGQSAQAPPSAPPVQSTNMDQPDHPPSPSESGTSRTTIQLPVTSNPLPWILIAIALLIAAILAYFFVRNR
jgi:hypothetical protein